MVVSPIPQSQQLVTTVTQRVNEAEPSKQLAGFVGLKKAIQDVTGQLPEKCKPLVGQLSEAYNNAWKGITFGLPIAATNASKYVTKVHAVLLRGQITEREEKQLADLVPPAEYLHELQNFVNDSCDLMTTVHTALMDEANGGKVEKLQGEADKIQKRMKVLNASIFNTAVSKGAAESVITRNVFELEYVELAITDIDAATARMQTELQMLEATIPALDKSIMDHRDTKSHNYVDIGVLKVHLGSARNDNGERIAQAALDRQLANIRQLKQELKAVSKEDLSDRKTRAFAAMKLAQGVLDAESGKLKKLEDQYEADSLLLQAKREEIQTLFDRAGVTNADVMNQVKVIADAAINAYTSLHTSHGAMRTDVGQLSSDPDHFVPAVLSALSVMRYNDEVFQTSILKNTKKALELQR